MTMIDSFKVSLSLGLFPILFVLWVIQSIMKSPFSPQGMQRVINFEFDIHSPSFRKESDTLLFVFDNHLFECDCC
jgi:hypothetical protein